MGVMYQKGQGMAADYDAALKWYRHAAELGNGAAMSNIGVLYQEGLGVKADQAEAAKWFAKARAAGESESNNGLQNEPSRTGTRPRRADATGP